VTDSPARPRGGWPSGSGRDDDGWGPSTATYSAGAQPSHNRLQKGFVPVPTVSSPGARRPLTPDDGWSPAGPPAKSPASKSEQRANKLMERQLREMHAQRAHERGVPWWAALLVLIVIAALGGVIDTVGSIQVRGGFNIGIVVASIVAILLVKRSNMFPIVIAPPIVYSLAAVFQLYLRSSGLHDKKVVLDAAANYLVYGFPAIAAATAAVLIIAGIRLITRK
jgi:hypothetical protein